MLKLGLPLSSSASVGTEEFARSRPNRCVLSRWECEHGKAQFSFQHLDLLVVQWMLNFVAALESFFNLPERFQWNTREANAPLPPIFLFFSIFKFLCLKLETSSSYNWIRCFSYPRVKDAPFFIKLLDCLSNLFQRLHAVSEVLFLVLFPGGALMILFINLFLGSNEVKWHGK